METILKYDRVILVKELNEKFKQLGQLFEIANIFENSFLLRSADTKVALGVVSFEDFERCFVATENYKGWTPWESMVGFDGQSDVEYRTNRKKTQVRFLTDRIVGESCCTNGDEFNLNYGIRLAYLRALNKARIKQKAELEAKLAMVEHEIAENECIMKKMVNSLS